MYDYLKGRLAYFGKNSQITLDIGGVGYSIFVPLNCFAKLPAIGSLVTCYTSLIIREDAHLLFGFLQRKQRDLFETLTGLSGIGPKTALNIIGHVDYDHLLLSIAKADIKMLAKIPGLGKKSSERLVIEMRGKCQNLQDAEKTGASVSHAQAQGPAYDAVSALVNLGYSAKEAQSAVDKAMDFAKEKNKADLQDAGKIIALALKQKI